MPAILWDQSGDRFYQAGVDRGVLYLPDGTGVPWNGLISINESVSGNEASPIYFDGVKFADVVTLGEFSASLKAYTYPDEFLQFEGVLEVGNGLFVTNQPVSRFNLSYRTKIGNDDSGDLGYKIHVIYNLMAIPQSINYETISSVNVVEFEWAITSIPVEVSGFHPTAHLIFDSRFMGSLLIEDIEHTLYGDKFNDASLPSLSTLTSFISQWVIMRITDNYDGTWTVIGPDSLIKMLDSTTFQIIQANAEYLDENTYIISDLTY
jgi:hypothetical protein